MPILPVIEVLSQACWGATKITLNWLYKSQFWLYLALKVTEKVVGLM